VRKPPTSQSTKRTSISPVPSSSTPPVEPRLLRISHAASYIGATPWFIRSLIWGNRIPYVTLGKRHLIDRKDLDAYVERVKVSADPDSRRIA
jgi:excisionase family DNA binding protein